MPIPLVSTHLWGHWLLTSLVLMRQHYWRWALTASSLFPQLILCKQAATWIQPGNEKTTRRPHHIQRGYKTSWPSEKCEGDNTLSLIYHISPWSVSWWGVQYCLLYLDLITFDSHGSVKNKDRYGHICPDRNEMRTEDGTRSVTVMT